MQKKIMLALLLAVPATAFAQDKPEKPKIGAETRALEAIAFDGTSTGKMPAGAMGPDSPEIPTKGKNTCKWTNDNLWLSCEVSETMGTGKQVMNWKGTIYIGWDFSGKEYRAVGVDTMGSSMYLSGDIEGNTLVLTSVSETMHQGKMTKFRLTYDWSDPKAIKMTNECAQDGKGFEKKHESTLIVGKRHPLPKQAAS